MNGETSRSSKCRRGAVASVIAAAALACAATPAHAQEGVDKALGQLASASSVEGPDHSGGACRPPNSCAPGLANDGRTTTRWSSEFNENEFWQVDLGRPRLVDTVALTWEPAHPELYRISTSLDGVTFTTAAEPTLRLSAAEKATLEVTRRYPHTTSFAARSARFVRITSLKRAPNPFGRVYGISIWDAAVFGPPDTAAIVLPTPPAGADPTPISPPPRTTSPSSGAPSLPPPSSVAGAALRPLEPRPVVRIKGVLTARGARISLFTVRAPTSARVRVRCTGPGCPARVKRRKGRLQRFPELQKHLRAGVVIEAFVTKRGTYGRYTRLVIRQGNPPGRSGGCVLFGSRTPVACPT